MHKLLEEILTEDELNDLKEILDFSLGTNVVIDETLQKTVAYSSFWQSKLVKIMFKLRLTHNELEVEFEHWVAKNVHAVAFNYDGKAELLKTPKDYERELRREEEYVETMKILKVLEATIKSLESKEKELLGIDWKIKEILDIQKIKLGLI